MMGTAIDRAKVLRRAGLLAVLAAVVATVGAVRHLGARRPSPTSRGATGPGAVARAAPRADGRGVPAVRRRITSEGIAVDFTIEVLRREGRAGGPLRERDDVAFRFAISDTTTGAPLKNAYPAAWLARRKPGEREDARACLEKARTFIGGSLFTPADLDLNVYHLLALNGDATLTVVDPLMGFGGSKLLALVTLAAAGGDWALGVDQARLFVAMPEADKVAVVDTATWQVRENLDAGRRPTRLALQPDGHYLWVAHDPGGPGGDTLSVVDVDASVVVAVVRVGRGPHEIAFPGDSRHAFVTNPPDGTVSVIDIPTLRKTGEIRTGSRPTALACSALAGMAYVTDAVDGTIVALDAGRLEVAARIRAEPGLGPIGFAPGGRHGFVVNPARALLHILDTSSNRLIQRAALGAGPDQVTFSDDFAYIRQRGTENVLMVPLAQVGGEGRPVPTVEFPAGQNPLGKVGRPTPAASIVQAPGENAVLVANPSDKSVYYYKEGMSAPMGNFSNYGREPRAILVVDRSLREREAPGVYRSIARLPGAGSFDVVFFLDTPRIAHCFRIEVEADPATEATAAPGRVDLEPLIAGPKLTVGRESRLRFRLRDRGTGEAKTGLADVNVRIYLAPGIWQTSRWGREDEEGAYFVDFLPPRPGYYYVSVECASVGLPRNNPRRIILEAEAPGAKDPPSPPAEARPAPD